MTVQENEFNCIDERDSENTIAISYQGWFESRSLKRVKNQISRKFHDRK